MAKHEHNDWCIHTYPDCDEEIMGQTNDLEQRARELYLQLFGAETYLGLNGMREGDAMHFITQALRDVREADAKVAKGKRNSKVLKDGMYSVQDAYNEACDDIEAAIRSQRVNK